MRELSAISFELETFYLTSMQDPYAQTAFEILSQEVLQEDCSQKDFLDRMADLTCIGAVSYDDSMESEGTLLGVGCVNLDSSDASLPFGNAAFFDLLATKEAYKEGHGIGSAIAREAILQAGIKGYSGIYGIIENDSTTFHERFGYEEHVVSHRNTATRYMHRSITN